MAGATANSKFTCKKCDRLFENASEFHKHSWAVHRNEYRSKEYKWICKKCGKKFNSRSRIVSHSYVHRAPRLSKKDLIPTVRTLKDSQIQSLNGGAPKSDMLVSELLEKLKSQRNFMVDVVNLIEGLAKSNS